MEPGVNETECTEGKSRDPGKSTEKKSERCNTLQKALWLMHSDKSELMFMSRVNSQVLTSV